MSDLKTALTTALKEANVPVKPQMQRIWEYLQENPGRTSARMRRDLYIEQNSVSSLLSQLVRRGMATFKDEQDRLGRRRLFYVSPSMREYELLPKKTTGVKTSNPVKTAEGSLPVTVEEVPRQPTDMLPTASVEKPVSQQQVVDTFTVAQAREMYGILHKMFGEKK